MTLFLHEIQLSLRYYWRAIKFVEKHNLWRLLIITAILNLIAAAATWWLAWKTSGYIINSMIGQIDFEENRSSLFIFMERLLLIGVRASIFFLYIKVFRYLLLILYAPLFTYISGRIQAMTHQQKYEFHLQKYFSDCFRSMRIAARNFIIELILTLGVLFLAILITWLAPLAPLVILLLESYFFGYSMADYRSLFLNISEQESRNVIHAHRGLIIGNGLFFNLSLLIPLFGVLFAPLIALIASGLSINCAEKRKSILCPSNQSTLIMAES